MRILTFSDWRVQSLESLFDVVEGLAEPVDLICYAGDDIRRFREDDRNVFTELAAETTAGAVLAVMGNDDLPQARTVLQDGNVHDLYREPFVYGDYVFLGVEGAVEGPCVLLHSEDEIRDHLEHQYAGHEAYLPVVVSHVPPHGILDIGRRFGQRHIGSVAVRRFLEAVEPVVTVCGHCHQFGGRAADKDFGTVINIASHDDPGAEGRYAVIELDGRDVRYELSTTAAGVDHHLLQLSQIGQTRIARLTDAGITELEQITEANRDVLRDLPGSSEWHVDLWIQEAAAIRNGEIRVQDPDEFAVLESDDILLVDIETDLSQDRIWLIGLYSYRDGAFTQLFEKDDEVQLLETFIRHLRSLGGPTVVYYGGNRFDEHCLTQRLQAHGLAAGVDLLADAYDLGITVQHYLLGEFRRTGLAYLAGKLADYEYTHPELDGFVVGKEYTQYLLDGTEPDWDQLLAYNKDDVLALKAVVDRIRELL